MSTRRPDWRELYAANRAAIERAGAGRGGARGFPAGALPADLPGGPLGGGPLAGGPSAPPPTAAGQWAPLAVGHAAGGRSCWRYTPPDLPARGGAPAMIVLLHGCNQTAASIAAESRMLAAADRDGFVVLCPEQARRANQLGCWNWFAPAHQTRGAGEPAFIAAAVRAALHDGAGPRVDPGRVLVCGLSAGGAMAAIVAATHPELFAAVAVHSGLPFRAATSLDAAFAAMSRGGEDGPALRRAAFDALPPGARPVPALVIHGSADTTVAPANADRLVEQSLAAHALARPGATAVPETTEASRGDGLASRRRAWRDGRGELVVQELRIEGLGHAWSGGAPGAYSDPRGPSATDAMLALLAEVGSSAGSARARPLSAVQARGPTPPGRA